MISKKLHYLGNLLTFLVLFIQHKSEAAKVVLGLPNITMRNFDHTLQSVFSRRAGGVLRNPGGKKRGPQRTEDAANTMSVTL